MDQGGTQNPELLWRDNGTPVSARFDDPYFSVTDGLAESRYVFLDGNDLPARFTDGFTVAELGFGTGLNFLALQMAWAASGTQGRLRYVSFEAYPMTRDDRQRALAAWPELEAEATALADLLDRQPQGGAIGSIDLDLRIGDARDSLPGWDGAADAWFLDGFSPNRNPELWSPELMQAVGRHTRTGGSFATYTAAGHVRRALDAAGFDVSRRPGFGSKRHMSTGRLRPAAGSAA
ncbi:tRNA (5-methylaminomethyl-2-thiouridine)(34)-methyltransferase MnmD [Oceanomicrobium pacificus]|uniref:tRNA (5-methylaminomethyl-2-thiouridine)(34)-methyltransferase MnmD n=1 Tax=Oceanomicrobium pacificus TaxID=2692916 RepID=A0A6B0TS35_9RHOB|nr:tRNA (5-methylaminomethyl-2-thiouridine)(34)-methyltransferase MnmD [Oceanomicrobium pacificus]MXU64154.1 tRNA (5-methylaminomethyl-2-thiouridine)(34)-methyltransferase MnmD [Oceanomicrobium pacificus]